MSISICRRVDRDNGLWTAEKGYIRLYEVLTDDKLAREYELGYDEKHENVRRYRREAEFKIAMDKLHRLKMGGA